MTGVTFPSSTNSFKDCRSDLRGSEDSERRFWRTSGDMTDAGAVDRYRRATGRHPPPNGHQSAVRGEGTAKVVQGTIAGDVNDHIVLSSTVGKILARVVKYRVGADGPDHVHFRGTAHARDMSIKRLGDLHGERSDAFGGADDESFLAWPQLSLVSERLQGCNTRGRDGCCLLEAQIFGLFSLLGHRLPNRLQNNARHVPPQPRVQRDVTGEQHGLR